MVDLGFSGVHSGNSFISNACINHVVISLHSKVTQEAAQLQAVMMKNPKKSRPSCTRAAKQQPSVDGTVEPADESAPTENQETMVCEISDDETESPKNTG